MPDSETDLLSAFGNLSVADNCTDSEPIVAMDPHQLKQIMESAISSALSVQAEQFNAKIQDLTDRLERASSISAPQVISYEPVTIDRSVKCEDTLDVVKSLVDFSGDHDNYVSWRQAAHVAYEQFEPFAGSVKHYQAVSIIRNKVKGNADGILTSFSTPLNFHAIISRLDAWYADKTPLYVLEGQLSVLRQGNLSVPQYYEAVERILNQLTNKVIMTYEKNLAKGMVEKYRGDALRVFISGLKKSLSDTVFSARPKDMPSALALAEELEGNRERYNFASSFTSARNPPFNPAEIKIKREVLVPKESRELFAPPFKKVSPNYTAPIDRPEPMEIGSTMSKIQNNYNNHRSQFKRPISTADRESDRRRQRINNLVDSQESYEEMVKEQLEYEDEEDIDHNDELNFLEEGPSSHM